MFPCRHSSSAVAALAAALDAATPCGPCVDHAEVFAAAMTALKAAFVPAGTFGPRWGLRPTTGPRSSALREAQGGTASQVRPCVFPSQVFLRVPFSLPAGCGFAGRLDAGHGRGRGAADQAVEPVVVGSAGSLPGLGRLGPPLVDRPAVAFGRGLQTRCIAFGASDHVGFRVGNVLGKEPVVLGLLPNSDSAPRSPAAIGKAARGWGCEWASSSRSGLATTWRPQVRYSFSGTRCGHPKVWGCWWVS